MNSAAMNIGVHASFSKESFVWIYAQEWDFWVIYPKGRGEVKFTTALSKLRIMSVFLIILIKSYIPE